MLFLKTALAAALLCLTASATLTRMPRASDKRAVLSRQYVGSDSLFCAMFCDVLISIASFLVFPAPCRDETLYVISGVVIYS